MLLGNHIFDNSSHEAFIFASNDFNPIHADAVLARKTISGKPIVHGIHSFLWALNLLYLKKNKIYQKFVIKFLKPVFLNDEISCLWDDKKELLKIIDKFGSCLVSIRCADMASNYKRTNHGLNTSMDLSIKTPNAIKFEDLSEGLSVKRFCKTDPKHIGDLFRELEKLFGIDVLIEVVRLSSIIGMQIPGRDSIFSQCRINLKLTECQPSLTIKSLDHRFKLIKLDYAGINLNASLEAFFRPPPITSDNSKIIAEKTNLLKRLPNHKVLIIGGSRGLGAWTAKILASLGSDVTITYNLGEEDAIEIQSDINRYLEGKCDYFHLDVNRISDLKINETYNQMYYFATPKIFGKQDSEWDEIIFEKFLSCYVNNFENIATSLIRSGTKKILFPSTIAIEKPVSGLEEYIEAKSLGEEKCKNLEKFFNIKIFTPRIDRVLTDQTATIFPTKSNDPFSVALDLIKIMNS